MLRFVLNPAGANSARIDGCPPYFRLARAGDRDTHLRANFEAQALVERDRSSVRRPGVQERSFFAASVDFGRHCG